MKKEFYGFYEPTRAEIDKAWADGIFVFDANALLNLYRYSNPTRTDFLMVVAKLKGKLFMPHQVGFEYHSNRHLVIETLHNSYEVLRSGIKEICEKNIAHTLNQYLRHPAIQVNSLKGAVDDFLKKIESELELQKKNHPDFKTKDDILIQLTDLYENKVGAQFSKDDLKKIYIEGKERYEQFIPPGYKDLESKRKKGDQHVYGDLIIWKQMIDLAKREKKEIVFVTDDRKEDWWRIENGKTIGPREELIKEFYDLTGIRILIYNADNFLHFAKSRNLAAEIKETSITEVKEVRKADEEYLTFSDLIKADLINRSEKFKSAQWFQAPGTAIPEILKNVEQLKLYQWYHPNGSAVPDILKSLEDLDAFNWYKPAGSTIPEFFKSVEGLTSFNWNEPAKSIIFDVLKGSVDPKFIVELPPAAGDTIKIDEKSASEKETLSNGPKNADHPETPTLHKTQDNEISNVDKGSDDSKNIQEN